MKFEPKDNGLLGKLIISVIIVWGLSAVFIFFGLDDWATRGTFGDLFGAVNALFSGLAFAAILYTLSLQRQEMKLNREEIELNRKELSKSVKAQQASQKVLMQQVEQTHLTAKINAMNTLIEYYNNQIQSASSSPELIERAKQKRKTIIRQIDTLIDGINDSENE